MKYIVVNRTPGCEGMTFLKAGRAGIPSELNPPRLYESNTEAEMHARLVRSMLGGEWRVELYTAREEPARVECAMG